MLQETHYESSFFSLKIELGNRSTALVMQLLIPWVNTKDLPHTKDFFNKNFPSVLRTQCFNDKNLPFSLEIEETEIGHLFEHILIDQLCILKIQSGAESAVFNGQTFWNWQKNPYGCFQILIDIGKSDLNLFKEALTKAIELTERLIEPGVQIFLNQETTGNLTSRSPVVLS